MNELSTHTFRNPNFVPDGHCADYTKKHGASIMAHELNALIRVCTFALESENSPVSLDKRGVGLTLQLAENIAGDLIDLCEELERGKER